MYSREICTFDHLTIANLAVCCSSMYSYGRCLARSPELYTTTIQVIHWNLSFARCALMPSYRDHILLEERERKKSSLPQVMFQVGIILLNFFIPYLNKLFGSRCSRGREILSLVEKLELVLRMIWFLTRR